MCGIFASAGFEPDEKRIDIVAHRGPDGRGWLQFDTPVGPVALGHRRLAIIDVSRDGLQPVADPTGRYQLTYNGEIYNYRTLRRELEQQGIHFRTHTDTEVLLQALIVWGDAALPRLEGMFAFVLFDTQEQQLFAARDRFGIKPLYYAISADGIAFGSEIKQLLGLVPARGANVARVADFLLDGVSDHTSETMFADILQVRGGESLRVGLGQPIDPTQRPKRWYSTSMPAALDLEPAAAAAQFRSLLMTSVHDHLRADVTVGSCLSGGLDSSAIVCLMAQMLGTDVDRLRTVTACYTHSVADERPFAESVVAATGAAADYIYPREEDVFSSLSELTWHQDEPFGSSSIFAQWSVFQEAARVGIKVMLDGQGADEQLAGYHGMFGLRMRELIANRQFGEALRIQWQRRQWHGAPFFPPLSQILRALGPSDGRTGLPEWLSGDARAALAGRSSALATAAAGLGMAAPRTVNDMCRLMVHASNLPMLLHWEDRNSMAHSVEARVPFLDHRLVEFSLGLPSSHKFVGGDTKRVLRDAMAGVLPEKVRLRRDKLGFATPEEIWLKGPLRGLAMDGVETALRQFPGLLEPVSTRAMAGAMLEGKLPFHFGLWRIISLGAWGKRFGVAA